jgi:hypothetical protein
VKDIVRFVVVSTIVVIAGGCAARSPAAAPEPVSDPSTWSGDVQLYHLLDDYPLTPTQQDSLTLYLQSHSVNANELLVEAVRDTMAPPTVRANALMTLAERKATAKFPAFRAALDDPDPRVRATAVAAMREFVGTHGDQAMRLARSALQDPDPTVQAQALQLVGEQDVDLLRAYVKRAPNAELRAVANDLIAVAEQRGAPLVMDSATGVLRRTTAHGYALTFTPTKRWPSWQAAVGDVIIAQGNREIARLSGIESVANVVPVFLSPTGSHIVFERNREIVVRNLATGAERTVGAGIAPRVLPFTDTFIFLRETPDSQTELRQETRASYVVLREPFERTQPDAAPTAIGATQATLSPGRHGNYSPARWMRVRESAGTFQLHADGLEKFDLPNPFSTANQDG